MAVPSKLLPRSVTSNIGVGFVDSPKDLSPGLLESIADPNLVQELDYYKKLFSTNLLIVQPIQSVVVGTDFGSVLETYASTTLKDGTTRNSPTNTVLNSQRNQNINAVSGQPRILNK